MNNIEFIASFFGTEPHVLLSTLDTEIIQEMVNAVEDEDYMALHHLGYKFHEVRC